jgi:plasmid stability protein
MAQLIVRNLEDRLVRLLERRAAAHGRSAEEEHREILRQALLPKRKRGFKELLLSMPDVGEDADFSRIDDRRREVPSSGSST